MKPFSVMEAINGHRALIVLSVVAVLYAAWMIWYFMRGNRRGGKQGKTGGESSPPSGKKRKGDIVGKSHFVLPEQSHSQPLTAIESESENRTGNEDIFAQENVPQHPRQISPEELDDVFGVPPAGEANEPLDLDFPLYVESFPEEDTEDAEEEDEDETDDSPSMGKSYAQGASFEELGEAYRRVVHNPIITEDQKEETGRILLNLKGTDMYGIIVSGKPEREDRVRELIDTYLSAFDKRISEKSAESPPPQGDIPSGFNVRDFV